MILILNKKLLLSWFIYQDLRNIKKYEIVSKISRNMKSLDFIQQFTYRELARSSYRIVGLLASFPSQEYEQRFCIVYIPRLCSRLMQGVYKIQEPLPKAFIDIFTLLFLLATFQEYLERRKCHRSLWNWFQIYFQS